MKNTDFLFVRTTIMIDPLSEVLSLLQVTGMLTARMEARGLWAMQFPPYKHMKFGTVLQGNLWLWADDITPVCLQTGDFYLLTSGKSYCCGSEPGILAVDGSAVLALQRDTDGIVRYGNGESVCEAVGGKFVFDEGFSQLPLKDLPPVILTRNENAASPLLRALITLISQETISIRPGHHIAANSLATLALVQIFREWMEDEQNEFLWFSALRDRKISRALSLIHSAPSFNWTLSKLASESAMSRTAFASRFRQLTGYSAINYLIMWRMELACSKLKKNRESISEISESTGYISVPSFSLAFRRYTGMSPGAWRRLYSIR